MDYRKPTIKAQPEAVSILEKVDAFLRESHVNGYLVGGFVRDGLLGRSTADVDLAINGDALNIAREVANRLGGSFVPLDEFNQIARVVVSSQTRGNNHLWCLDFSSFSSTIEDDLARRDFTIDAMALSLSEFVAAPATEAIIDPHYGRADLEKKIVRAVSPSVFEADSARLLRAVRLAAELGFTIDTGTETFIRQFAPLIARVAGERVRDELLRVLSLPGAGKFVGYLDDLHLLTAIIPEIESARGVEQPQEHHWDVFEHSLQTVRAVDFLLRQGDWQYVAEDVLGVIEWSDKLAEYFATPTGPGSTRAALLRLAALLHDVSKPATKIMAKERIRFFGHTEQGADVAMNVLERLRFTNKEIKLVEAMVRHHMRPTQLSQGGLPSPRAIYRYFRDTGSAGVDILFLSLADHLAARGPALDLDEWRWHADQVNCLLAECNRQTQAPPPKLIDGHDLIQIFGLDPGPQIRTLLEEVKEAQAAGELVTREQALSYVKNRLLY